jgi:hypothetical protein
VPAGSSPWCVNPMLASITIAVPSPAPKYQRSAGLSSSWLFVIWEVAADAMMSAEHRGKCSAVNETPVNPAFQNDLSECVFDNKDISTDNGDGEHEQNDD